MYECVCIFVYNGYVICKKWYQEKYLGHVCLVKRKIMYNVQALCTDLHAGSFIRCLSFDILFCTC